LGRAWQQKTYAFERARSYGVCDGALVNAILLLKWERMEPLGAWLAARLVELALREGRLLRRTSSCRFPFAGTVGAVITRQD